MSEESIQLREENTRLRRDNDVLRERCNVPNWQRQRVAGGVWVFLDDYEIANLKAALDATGVYGGMLPNPLAVLNNGDWLGQIQQKLDSITNHRPNKTSTELADAARKWTP